MITDQLDRLRVICTNRIGTALPNPDLTEALALLDGIQVEMQRAERTAFTAGFNAVLENGLTREWTFTRRLLAADLEPEAWAQWTK